MYELKPERIVVYKKGKVLGVGKNTGYYLVEFSYDQNKFIIHLSDIETSDEYVKELTLQRAEDLLKVYENDYDTFAETLLIRGNQVVLGNKLIKKIESNDKMFARNIHDWKKNSFQIDSQKNRTKSILNNTFRKRIKSKAYNTIHKVILAQSQISAIHQRSKSVNKAIKWFKESKKFQQVPIKQENTPFTRSTVNLEKLVPKNMIFSDIMQHA